MKKIENIRRKIVFLYLIVSHSLFRYWQKLTKKNDLRNQPKNRLSLLNLLLQSKKYLAIFLLLLSALIVILKLGVDDYRRETVSEGVVGIYTGNTLPQSVAVLISQPLVGLDKSGKPEPRLASGWQVNNDATVYTFKLRENLYWNDGTELKSSDIRFNLHDVEVSYPDDSTIEFKLADSFYPFPSLLTAPVFKGDSLTGIGKFKVTSWEVSKNIITKLILSQTQIGGDLPDVIIRFYPDENIARIAFGLGEIQSLIGLNDEGGLKNQPGVKFKKVPNFNKLVAVFYNTKDPALSDKNLRKALSYATPEIEGEEKAKTSIPTNSWAFNNSIKSMTGDMDSAKTYLGKVSGKTGTVTLTTTPLFSDLGEKVVQSWKKAGINAVLRVESGIPQNFQALLIAQVIPSDPDQYTLWHSTQIKTNVSRYDTNKRVDKDLEDGRKSGDMEKRKEKYVDLQKVLADDAPATFLYFQKSWVVYRQKSEATLNKVLNLQIPQS